MYHGDIVLEQTLDFKFTTRRFTTGVPYTLAGTPSLACYVGNSTTEITAGITLTVDFDSRAGLNHVRIVASSGNGYAAQTDVDVVIVAGTVDSVSVVGEVIGSFSIENRSALRPTTAGRTLDISSNGNAGIDWGNIDNPTTAQNLSATNIDVDQVVASVSGAVGSVTGNVGGNVNGNLVGNVNGNVVGNVNGSVASIAAGGITAASFAANAIAAAALAAAAANKIADSVLRRNMATARASSDGDAITSRSLLGQLSTSQNANDQTTTPGSMTVFEEDDTTPFFERPLDVDALALPIIAAGGAT